MIFSENRFSLFGIMRWTVKVACRRLKLRYRRYARLRGAARRDAILRDRHARIAKARR